MGFVCGLGSPFSSEGYEDLLLHLLMKHVWFHLLSHCLFAVSSFIDLTCETDTVFYSIGASLSLCYFLK